MAFSLGPLNPVFNRVRRAVRGVLPGIDNSADDARIAKEKADAAAAAAKKKADEDAANTPTPPPSAALALSTATGSAMSAAARAKKRAAGGALGDIAGGETWAKPGAKLERRALLGS